MTKSLTFDELLEFINGEAVKLEKKYSKSLSKRELEMAHLLKAMEELGELAEALLAHYSIQRQDKLDDKGAIGTLKEELADVLITTLLLAQDLDIDIQDALREKMAKIKQRKY